MANQATPVVERTDSTNRDTPTDDVAPRLQGGDDTPTAGGVGGGFGEYDADRHGTDQWRWRTKVLALAGIVLATLLVGALTYKVNTMSYAGYRGSSTNCKVVAFPSNIDRCLRDTRTNHPR